MNDTRPHFLYRCFDKQGRLLYIGATVNVRARMRQHLSGRSKQKTSYWLAACYDHHEVEGPFVGRQAGLEAERVAIRTEQPMFNLQERRMPGWLLLPGIGEHLIHEGHLDLAIETTCSCTCDHREFGEIAPYCAPHKELAAQGIHPDWVQVPA